MQNNQFAQIGGMFLDLRTRYQLMVSRMTLDLDAYQYP